MFKSTDITHYVLNRSSLMMSGLGYKLNLSQTKSQSIQSKELQSECEH